MTVGRDILNTALVAVVAVTQAALLWTASRVSGWTLAAVAIAFAFIFLTNYALMHEASHGSLHRRRRVNDLLGTITGVFFPTSATMMRVTHVVHHRCNRTDHEMFDCYYPGDRVWLKRAQWYSILTGLFYVIIPIGAFVVAFLRPLLMTAPFKRARSSSRLFDDFSPRELWRVRLECLLLVAIYVPLLMYGVLAPGPTLLLFVAGGVNWSTRQYVTHAWSIRHVVDGAHNLRAGPLMRALLLNGNWDLVHHQYPLAAWTELPRLAVASAPPIGFWRQYLSQWRGPVPAAGPGPAVLADLAIAARAPDPVPG